MQRRTAQRQAIREAFADAGRPLDVHEAHARAAEQLPRLGVATVYRAINDLVDEGFLRRVELPGEPARFELADLEHHHHFRCTRCDRVFDIEGCALAGHADLPEGFVAESHEVVYYGRCPACAKRRNKRRKSSR
jgi:Fur family ferric uptake transcriptional regulator